MLLEKLLVLMSRSPKDSEFAKRLQVFVIDICEWCSSLSIFSLFFHSCLRWVSCERFTSSSYAIFIVHSRVHAPQSRFLTDHTSVDRRPVLTFAFLHLPTFCRIAVGVRCEGATLFCDFLVQLADILPTNPASARGRRPGIDGKDAAKAAPGRFCVDGGGQVYDAPRSQMEPSLGSRRGPWL